MTKRRDKVVFIEAEEQILKEGGDRLEYCLELFMRDMTMRNLAYHTKRWYKENLMIIHRSLQELGYPLEPINTTESMLKDVIIYCMEKLKNNPTTINHRIRSMKQFYSFLYNQSIISTNPTITIQKQKGKKERIKPFDKDELKALLDQPDRKDFVGFRDYTIMLILLDTGVRLSELVNMKTTDIYMEQGKILVLGKGSKEREVPFQVTTKEQLKRYIKVRGELHHDYLWISREDNPISRKNVQDRLKQYGELAGISNKRVSPHTFRHTCAKLYITGGGDIFSLQELLGHSSLEMCRHYVSLWGSDLQTMHRKFSPVESITRR
jgi:integrase/recombinase XerD